MKKKYTNEEFLDIANANKFEGYYKGKPVYSNPYVPDGIIYFINEDYIKTIPREKKTPCYNTHGWPRISLYKPQQPKPQPLRKTRQQQRSHDLLLN